MSSLKFLTAAVASVTAGRAPASACGEVQGAPLAAVLDGALAAVWSFEAPLALAAAALGVGVRAAVALAVSSLPWENSLASVQARGVADVLASPAWTHAQKFGLGLECKAGFLLSKTVGKTARFYK